MLRHIDQPHVADRIFAALARVLAERNIRTRDLGGAASTTEFSDAICRELER
jgi:isocitrate dehydrogenase (NAD+)